MPASGHNTPHTKGVIQALITALPQLQGQLIPTPCPVLWVGKRGGINHGNSLLWSRPFFDEPRAQATGVHSRGYADRIRGLTSRLSLFVCTTTCFDSPMPLPHIVRPASPPPAHAAHSFSLSHPNPGSSWPARLNQP